MTQVIRTGNGNFVAMINGTETYISADGKSWNAVETPCFEKLKNSAKIMEVEAAEPTAIYEEARKIIAEKNKAKAEAEAKKAAFLEAAAQEWEATQEVKRCDIGSAKVQLRSNGKLYIYQQMQGWRRWPLQECSRTAVEARLSHNLPLDKTGLPADEVAKIEEMEKQVAALMDDRTNSEKKIIADYKELIKNLPIEATYDNVCIVLRYLHLSNWGTWDLPQMTISYSAQQYDCDGVTASTIKLDRPISDKESGIENETRFLIGGRHGYLIKYQRIW